MNSRELDRFGESMCVIASLAAGQHDLEPESRGQSMISQPSIGSTPGTERSSVNHTAAIGDIFFAFSW